MILIIAVGDLPYKKSALAVLRDYFTRAEVPVCILEDDSAVNTHKRHPSWLKMLAHRIVPNERFIMCWDLDLLPNTRHFDLGPFVSSMAFNLCYDQSIALSGERFRPTFKYNTGLIGIPKENAEMCERLYEAGDHAGWPSHEQYYLNEEIETGFWPVNPLPQRFNAYLKMPEGGGNIHHTWNVSGPEKFDAIERHAEAYWAWKDWVLPPC